MQITIHSEQLYGELDKLASFTDAPPPAVTRVVFSKVDLAARAYIRELCRAANLIVREDAKFAARQDRKSTRLNSSHITISYAVFCLKKKKKTTNDKKTKQHYNP